MEIQETDKPFAIVLLGVKLAEQIFRLLDMYPTFISKPEMIEHLNVINSSLSWTLSTKAFSDFRASYQGVHIENKIIPDTLRKMAALSEVHFQGKETNYEMLLTLARDEGLERIYNRIYEIRCFDCKFPRPDYGAAVAAFDNLSLNLSEDDWIGRLFLEEKNVYPQRFFFLFTRYWRAYSSLLQDRGRLQAPLKPDPLSRFLAELRERIQFCLAGIEDTKFDFDDRERSLIDECLELSPEKSKDFPNEWKSYGLEILSEAQYYIEERATWDLWDMEWLPPLTEEEQIFLNSLEKAEKDYLQTATSHYQNAKEQYTPMAYIFKVETELRALIKEVFIKKFGASKWLEEIHRSIGEESYTNAISTMKRRSVASYDEILNFTYFKDLQRIINSHWPLFQDRFTCNRKEFNSLLSPIIKARNEEAHSRPENLWPYIEKCRTIVLCHDLLSKLKKNLQ